MAAEPIAAPTQEELAKQLGLDQAPPDVDKPDVKEEQKPLDQLVPKITPLKWNFETDDAEATYTQGNLSFLAKMEFFALIGETVQTAMQGENGLTIDGIMGSVNGAQNLFMNSTGGLSLGGVGGGSGVDAFLGSAARLSRVAPEFLLDCFCIWLAVPVGDRDWVKSCMMRPEDPDNKARGGLSDDDFFLLVETFIDQNGQAMWDFFTVRVPALVKRTQTLMSTSRPDDPSQSSKPSKVTRRTTRRR